MKTNSINNITRSSDIPVKNGVLQGDILSPTLFIVALCSIRRRLPKIIFNNFINELAYADDIAFINDNQLDCQAKLTKLFNLKDKTGLKLAFHRTKNMWITSTPTFDLT